MSDIHVIFGSGPLGRSVADALLRRGLAVRVATRHGTSPVVGVEPIAGDANDPSFALTATKGAAVVYQCAQPPYHRWAEEFPALQASILDAAAANGARLVLADNLYSYGDSNGAIITEDSPRNPTTKKGRVRKAMADTAMAAHAAGAVEVAISRPSDYFGPGYDVMGSTVFIRALRGKPMQLMGSARQPHTFSYVPDVGAAMAVLGTSEKAWGQVWIPPVQPAVTQADFAAAVWRQAGNTGKPRVQVLGRAIIGLGGLFSPSIRAVTEMLYEFEKPFIVDSSKFESTFGIAPTAPAEAIEATLAWYRAKPKG